ncbi:MAG: hypothetical protein J6W69_08905 [Bacteroidales bacterium]|nr:hypothetical protein [Bacteroidales bacterium]
MADVPNLHDEPLAMNEIPLAKIEKRKRLSVGKSYGQPSFSVVCGQWR